MCNQTQQNGAAFFFVLDKSKEIKIARIEEELEKNLGTK
ncbi:hypothetical protein FHS18_001781 [Paenibacillus phyllosphaerae]|uniref:Uncharacterized protein n=1 Tax=Paenibacillus phyllosphaerae TaxID=274593 RepID=A0A7W5AVZ1_9BACL|nr:hypothetical protein [Paenibacillus phyllosphaerae]